MGHHTPKNIRIFFWDDFHEQQATLWHKEGKNFTSNHQQHWLIISQSSAWDETKHR